MTAQEHGSPPLPHHLPDLRSYMPPGEPPFPVGIAQLPKRERQQLYEEYETAAAAYSKAHRDNPLPPDVHIVIAHDGYCALRVLSPGRVELWEGNPQAPTLITVSKVKRHPWRRSQLTLVRASDRKLLTRAAGKAQVIRTIPPGSATMADVGRVAPDHDFGPGLIDLQWPILTMILIVGYLVFFAFNAVRVMRHARATRRIAEELARAIDPGPPTG